MEWSEQDLADIEYAREVLESNNSPALRILKDEQLRHIGREGRIFDFASVVLDPSPMGAGKTLVTCCLPRMFNTDSLIVIGNTNGRAVFDDESLVAGTIIDKYMTFQEFAGKGEINPKNHNWLIRDNTPVGSGSKMKATYTFVPTATEDIWETYDYTDDDIQLIVDTLNEKIIVVDEVHKIKNETSNNKKAIATFLNGVVELITNYKENEDALARGEEEPHRFSIRSRIVLLTGTPYNKIDSAPIYLEVMGVLTSDKNFEGSDYYNENYGIGEVVNKGIDIEDLIGDGLVDAQYRPVVRGTSAALLNKYITGKGNTVASLARETSKQATSLRSNFVNNFYHEMFSRVFLPTLGDSMNLDRLGILKQRRFNMFVPLIPATSSDGVSRTVEERVVLMDSLIDDFELAMLRVKGGEGGIADLTRTNVAIQQEFAVDVVNAALYQLEGDPDAKIIIFSQYTNEVLTVVEQWFYNFLPTLADRKKVLGAKGEILKINGDIKGDVRSRVIRDYNADNNNYRIVLVSLGAGSETISLDDKFGPTQRAPNGRRRYSFIFPDFSVVNVYQAASRQQRLSTKSVGNIYIVNPFVNRDTVSIANVVAAGSTVLQFSTLSKEVEKPATYEIVIGRPAPELGDTVFVVPDDYPEIDSVFTQEDYREAAASGQIAFEQFKERNPRSEITFEEYKRYVQGAGKNITTRDLEALEGDEDEPSSSARKATSKTTAAKAPARQAKGGTRITEETRARAPPMTRGTSTQVSVTTAPATNEQPLSSGRRKLVSGGVVAPTTTTTAPTQATTGVRRTLGSATTTTAPTQATTGVRRTLGSATTTTAPTQATGGVRRTLGSTTTTTATTAPTQATTGVRRTLGSATTTTTTTTAPTQVTGGVRRTLGSTTTTTTAPTQTTGVRRTLSNTNVQPTQPTQTTGVRRLTSNTNVPVNNNIVEAEEEYDEPDDYEEIPEETAEDYEEIPEEITEEKFADMLDDLSENGDTSEDALSDVSQDSDYD